MVVAAARIGSRHVDILAAMGYRMRRAGAYSAAELLGIPPFAGIPRDLEQLAVEIVTRRVLAGAALDLAIDLPQGRGTSESRT